MIWHKMIKLNTMVKNDKKILYESYMRLHFLYRQFSGCNVLIYVLKELTWSNSFNVCDTKLHILGPKLGKLSHPW